MADYKHSPPFLQESLMRVNVIFAMLTKLCIKKIRTLLDPVAEEKMTRAGLTGIDFDFVARKEGSSRIYSSQTRDSGLMTSLV